MTGPSRECPVQPEWRAPQRARVVYGFEEAGERQEGAEHGWAIIDGNWLHFAGDESYADSGWQSWPASRITCVEWAHVEPRPF